MASTVIQPVVIPAKAGIQASLFNKGFLKQVQDDEIVTAGFLSHWELAIGNSWSMVNGQWSMAKLEVLHG